MTVKEYEFELISFNDASEFELILFNDASDFDFSLFNKASELLYFNEASE